MVGEDTRMRIMYQDGKLFVSLNDEEVIHFIKINTRL